MRIAIVSIFVENMSSVQAVNEILHGYSDYILGRMGLPKIAENLNVISLVVKAPQEDIAAMSGKLGSLDGVQAKANYAKVQV